MSGTTLLSALRLAGSPWQGRCGADPISDGRCHSNLTDIAAVEATTGIRHLYPQRRGTAGGEDPLQAIVGNNYRIAVMR